MIEKLCGEANVDAKDVIIAYLTKQVQELESQLYEASIQIQELTEQDMWCPSNCEKLEKLQKENQQLKEEVKAVNKGLRKVQERSIKYKNRCLKLNEKIKKIKQPQMFIDTQDIEERYAEELYQDFLKEENEKLKDNWDKLRKWLKEYEEGTYGLGSYETGLSDGLGDVIKKMQELEGSNRSIR